MKPKYRQYIGTAIFSWWHHWCLLWHVSSWTLAVRLSFTSWKAATYRSFRKPQRRLFLTQLYSKRVQSPYIRTSFQQLASVILNHGDSPEFMTVAEGWNLDRLSVKRFALRLSFTAVVKPVCVSVAPFSHHSWTALKNTWTKDKRNTSWTNHFCLFNIHVLSTNMSYFFCQLLSSHVTAAFYSKFDYLQRIWVKINRNRKNTWTTLWFK